MNHARAALAAAALFQVIAIIMWCHDPWYLAVVPLAMLGVLAWVAYVLECRYGVFARAKTCMECQLMGRNCTLHVGQPRD